MNKADLADLQAELFNQLKGDLVEPYLSKLADQYPVKYRLEMDTPKGDILHCIIQIPRDHVDPAVLKKIFQFGK